LFLQFIDDLALSLDFMAQLDEFFIHDGIFSEKLFLFFGDGQVQLGYLIFLLDDFFV
jgi:hypothetical protein